MKKLIFLLVFMSFCIISKAQFHVSGSVVNDNNKPIEGVYIVAYNVKTGISLKSCVSDRSGKYMIDLDKTKGVEIAFNLPGFKTVIMDKLLQTDLFKRVVMHDLSFVTDEVVISAEKYVMKPIEGGFNYKIIDKFIRNNNTSLDILNYTPMVHISNSESITKWWYINASSCLNYTTFIDKSEEVNLNKNGWSAEYSLNNFMTISKEKRFTSSITGNYFTNSINEYGKSYGFMQLNLSLKKNFDNFSLSLYAYRAWACRDGDFSTDRYASIDDKYRKGYSYSIGEYQGFRISFIWNLGNTKLNKNIRKGNNEYLRRV